MAYENLTKKRLTEDILFVLRYMYSQDVDRELVEKGLNERCLAARFFAYMMNHTYMDNDYKGLIWDPEYNRRGNAPKILEGKTVIPDLLLHKRGNDDANICVIEFKKSGEATKKDYAKLSKFTSDGYGFRYTHGIHIVFGVDEVSLAWFKEGGIEPYSVESFRTDTWESTSFLSDSLRYERRRTCTLMVTRACNLNCTYCYEPYKCNDHRTDMSFERAKEILCQEFEFVKNSSEYDEIEIDFMGGEPLLNMPLIKQVVEWLEENPPPVPWICFATTNGTLVKEHEEWLRQHSRSFQLGGSFDGTMEMQRLNRGTSENAVALELLHDLYPHQGFHMVISKETLPNMAEGILEIQRKGWKLEAALAHGVDWTESDAKIYGEQLEKLAKAYLKDKRLKPINLLTRPLMTIAEDPRNVEQKKFCGTGTHMVTYDYDGKAYGCHLFTPIVLGKNAKCIEDIDYRCEESNADPYCAECRLKGICPTCPGFNYRYRGSLGSRDHRWCRMILEQMQVACAFQIKKIAKNKRHTDEEIAFAKHALEAHWILSQISHEALAPYVV